MSSVPVKELRAFLAAIVYCLTSILSTTTLPRLLAYDEPFGFVLVHALRS